MALAVLRGSSFCLQSSLGRFHIGFSALLNQLPVGLALSPGTLRSALCPPPGRPLGAEHQPPLFNNSFQGMTSRGFLVLDTPLGVSCKEQGPKCGRELQVGPEPPRGSRSAWLESFSLVVASVGTELAPLPLPASVSWPVLPVPPFDSRGHSEPALRVPWLSEKNRCGATLTSSQPAIWSEQLSYQSPAPGAALPVSWCQQSLSLFLFSLFFLFRILHVYFYLLDAKLLLLPSVLTLPSV